MLTLLVGGRRLKGLGLRHGPGTKGRNDLGLRHDSSTEDRLGVCLKDLGLTDEAAERWSWRFVDLTLKLSRGLVDLTLKLSRGLVDLALNLARLVDLTLNMPRLVDLTLKRGLGLEDWPLKRGLDNLGLLHNPRLERASAKSADWELRLREEARVELGPSNRWRGQPELIGSKRGCHRSASERSDHGGRTLSLNGGSLNGGSLSHDVSTGTDSGSAFHIRRTLRVWVEAGSSTE